MKLKFLKICVAIMLVSVVLTACGRGRNNEDDFVDMPQVETPQPQPEVPPPPPRPDPTPEPAQPLTGISVPIVTGFADLHDGSSYLVDRDVDGEYMDPGNEIFIGWDGIDTLFVRAAFIDAAGISIAVSLAAGMPAAGAASRTIEVREHSISFLGNDEGFVEWAGILDAELLHYINSRGYIHGEIAIDTASVSAFLGDTGGYMQFEFEQADMPTVRFPIVGGFEDFARVRATRFTRLADGSPSATNHMVQAAWNGRDVAFLRFVVYHPHGVAYSTRRANDADWRDDDIVEVFMLPSMLASSEQNRNNARHWASNSEDVLLSRNSSVIFSNRSGFTGNMWVVDLAVPLDQQMREAIYANGYVIGGMAVVINSAEQEFLLGTTGEFWDDGTFLRFMFEGAEYTLRETTSPFETKRGVVEKDKFCEP